MSTRQIDVQKKLLQERTSQIEELKSSIPALEYNIKILEETSLRVIRDLGELPVARLNIYDCGITGGLDHRDIIQLLSEEYDRRYVSSPTEEIVSCYLDFVEESLSFVARRKGCPESPYYSTPEDLGWSDIFSPHILREEELRERLIFRSVK